MRPVEQEHSVRSFRFDFSVSPNEHPIDRPEFLRHGRVDRYRFQFLRLSNFGFPKASDPVLPGSPLNGARRPRRCRNGRLEQFLDSGFKSRVVDFDVHGLMLQSLVNQFLS